MAMSKKHFEAAATEAGRILSEIKGHDTMLNVILRADVAEAMVRVVTASAASDNESRFDADRFAKAMWAEAARHDEQ